MKDTQNTKSNPSSKESQEVYTRESVDPSEQDLDFEVTEAHSQDTELVGGYAAASNDDLGIESNADIVRPREQAAELEAEACEYDPSPIGNCDPTLPDADESDPDEDTLDGFDTGRELVPDYSKGSGLEKLSDEKVAEITRRMNSESRDSSYLSDEEKMRLVNGIESIDPDSEPMTKPLGFDNQPIVPPKKQRKDVEPFSAPQIELTGDKPQMSKRLRGVAHFAKGYIKISGEQELHDGDELVINGREYILRHKKVSNTLLFSVVGSLAAVLIFVLGTLFSSDADTGAGSIVGVVLDDNGQIYVSGAEVHFPELNQTYTANSQGFFKSDKLDAGSYKMEYWIDDQLLATDYATIVSDRLTTLSLKPEVSAEEPAPAASRTSAPPPARAESQPTSPPTKPAAAPTSKAEPAKSSSKSSTSTTSQWSKLTLGANVEGARLTLDGSVVGAGNLTYSKLKPGDHIYVVEKDGYRAASGTLRLTAGETARLDVALEKATPQQKAQTYAGQDYYFSGVSALEAADYETARSDFSEAIRVRPSYAAAHLKRAEANQGLHDTRSSHDDYLRAAEIYQFDKDYGQAYAAFGKALEMDDKSVAAYLGRGNLYLSRGEDIAAMADFDMVIRLDKRNIDGYLGLGQARYRQGAYGKATKHFKDARSLDAENPTIHKFLMLSFFGEGEFKDVSKSYEKFVKYATAEEVSQFRNDSRYSAILRVIDN